MAEWTTDLYHSDYNGAPTDGSAWVQNATSGYRILRGGSYDYDAAMLRLSSRGALQPATVTGRIGVRCVKNNLAPDGDAEEETELDADEEAVETS